MNAKDLVNDEHYGKTRPNLGPRAIRGDFAIGRRYRHLTDDQPIVVGRDGPSSNGLHGIGKAYTESTLPERPRPDKFL
jgi:hypothetical protein